MSGSRRVQDMLVEAGILPRQMPNNYTFSKVREILAGLDEAGLRELTEAVDMAVRMGVRGPLAAAVFIKHHLGGGHAVEVDRVEEGEGGARYAVLTYPEGEVPVRIELLPQGVEAGSPLRYVAPEGKYVRVAS